MNKKEVLYIIRSYRRNKKRIEEIRNEMYGISGFQIASVGGSSYPHDKDVLKIHRFNTNPEKIKLERYVNAVERFEELISYSNEYVMVYEKMMKRDNNGKVMEQYGISKSKAYRLFNELINMFIEQM